jgi:hypothetical protein
VNILEFFLYFHSELLYIYCMIITEKRIFTIIDRLHHKNADFIHFLKFYLTSVKYDLKNEFEQCTQTEILVLVKIDLLLLYCQ